AELPLLLLHLDFDVVGDSVDGYVEFHCFFTALYRCLEWSWTRCLPCAAHVRWRLRRTALTLPRLPRYADTAAEIAMRVSSGMSASERARSSCSSASTASRRCDSLSTSSSN